MSTNSSSKSVKWVNIEPENRQRLPEHNLLSGILTQAIRDIINVNQGKRCGESHHRRAALFWIDSESETADNNKFSFIQICQELGLNYRQVRCQIKRKLAAQDPNFSLRISRSANVRKTIRPISQSEGEQSSDR